VAGALLFSCGVKRTSSALFQRAIDSIEGGDTVTAIAECRTLGRALWDGKPGRISLDEIGEAFRTLLHRRGYFVSTPSDLASSLLEIHVLGEGFDLYDLAQALAALDTIVVGCLKLAPGPNLPELRAFASRCPCGHHSQDSSTGGKF
jgi:hypothetical protein